jgi:hypothetical protein
MAAIKKSNLEIYSMQETMGQNILIFNELFESYK